MEKFKKFDALHDSYLLRVFLEISVNLLVDNPPEPERVRLFGLVDVPSVDSI